MLSFLNPFGRSWPRNSASRSCRASRGNRPKSIKPALEAMEDRMLLSTLTVGLTGAVYTGGVSPGDSLTLSEQVSSGSTVERIFTDPVETISVHFTSPIIHPRVTGNGTHTVTWFGSSGFGSIAVNMQAFNDAVEIQSIDIPTTVTPGGFGNTIKVDVQTVVDSKGFTSLNIKAPVTVMPQALSTSTTNVIVDNSADTLAGNSHHWTLSNTAIANEYGTVVNLQQASLGTLNVTVDGSNPSTVSANIFTVTNTPLHSGFESGSLTINTGSGNESVLVQGTSGALTIQGHGGNDGVGIGDAAQTLVNILGSVTVRDTGPNTGLVIDDFGDTTSHTKVTLSDTTLSGLAPADIFFQASGLRNDVGAPGLGINTGLLPDTITVTNIPTFTNVLAGNSSGTDLVNVQGITGTLDVWSTNSATGSLKVVVGSSASGTGGTLAGINGVVNLPESSNTTLLVDDSGDTKPRTVTMTDLQGPVTDQTEITGLAPQATIIYGTCNIHDSSTLTINGGKGGDTFDITNTNIQVTNTTINGKGGDTFNVATTQSPLTLNTGAGSNRVNIQGTASAYLLVGPSPILNVVGHGGNDTVTVGSLAPALGGTLTNLFDSVNVSNTTNSTTLIVDDSGDSTPRNVTIGSNSVQFAGIGSPINFFAGVKSVEVLGGTSDRFQATTTAPTTPVTLVGGPGINTLISGGLNNTWVINGTDAGTLQSTIAFQNIQNLQGTGLPFDSDTFFFDNGASVTGSIVGGGNLHTTLDYAAYTTPVTVNLKTHQATGVKGGVAFVQNIIGGQGNNILVGDGNNYLQGGAGRDILISGGGTSTLQAGSGEAILLGARYTEDTNKIALDALMAEWSHTYDSTNALLDYQIRVAHLEAGGGLNGSFLLNPSTVLPQAGSTTLITGAQLDFLFADLGDFVPKKLRFGEVKVPV